MSRAGKLIISRDYGKASAMSPRSPKLRPNLKKIVEAILFLIEEAAHAGQTLTQYEIVKSVFIGDIFHLKKFGRPITFDNYVAMKFGPVPSETYDMLKPDYRGADYFGEEWPLWDCEKAPALGKNAYQFVRPKRAANRKKLSQTDMAELSEALKLVKSLGFSGVKDWTHLLPAYTTAWIEGGKKKSYEMDYALLFEKSDKELVADLVHASKFAY